MAHREIVVVLGRVSEDQWPLQGGKVQTKLTEMQASNGTCEQGAHKAVDVHMFACTYVLTAVPETRCRTAHSSLVLRRQGPTHCAIQMQS